jgi:thiamine-phosphate pyrophosphorylase
MYRTVLITDGTLSDKHLSVALEEGLEAIQLRRVQGSFYHVAQKLREMTRPFGARLFINERVDIALAVGADGVHLPQGTFSPQSVKKMAPQLVVGVSVHSEKEALLAEKEGADYLHFGSIFESGEKKPQGLAKLQQVCTLVKIPVIAVGGITPLRADNCKKAGAFGVAAISVFRHTETLKETLKAFHTTFSGVSKPLLRGLQVIFNAETFGVVDPCLKAKISLLQFRHKGVFTSELMARLQEIKQKCEEKNVFFLINDRVDVALALNASGVHVGQEDVPVKEARKILGPKKIIGASAGTLRSALRAQEEGADYVAIGHIFPTTSKIKQGEPIGLKRLAFFKSKLTVPVFAIGGITCENARDVATTGADGVAVISAIAQNPFEASQKLVHLWT